MKFGEQSNQKSGRNFGKSTSTSEKLIEDESSKPMVYSTSKSGDGLSTTTTIHDDHHDHHSNTSSRLAMVVFFILLIMISIGVYLLFVNWPKISDPLDNRSASLAKALLTWYEQEIASDDHHHDNHDESTTPSLNNHHDDHEEEKFYWEETWPEPSDEDDDEDHHDEDDHNNKDHGSGGDEVKHLSTNSEDNKPLPINYQDEIKSNHDDTHNKAEKNLKKPPPTIQSNGNQPNDYESQVDGNKNHDSDDGDDDENGSNDVVNG